MNLKTEINLADFFDEYALREIAMNVASRSISSSLDTQQQVERVITNAAYEVFGAKVESVLGSDINKKIVEKVKKLAVEDESIRFAIFRDSRQYGDNNIGIGVRIIEDYVRERCVERIRSAVDRVLDKINLDTKKFERMVVNEAAKIVAGKFADTSGK